MDNNYFSEAALKDKPLKKYNLILKDKAVTTAKIANGAVVTEKIAAQSITRDKIADGSLPIEKLDKDLRDIIEAATGVPEDLVRKLQDIVTEVAELQDTVFPINLSLGVTNDEKAMSAYINYMVTCKGELITPDTLELRKNGAILTNSPRPQGIIASIIGKSKEEFVLTVGKKGRTSQMAHLTRYLCFYGGNAEDTISENAINTFSRAYTPDLTFTPEVSTKDREYIWIVVPEELSVTSIRNAGIEVALAPVQTISTVYGNFKAYRSANALVEETWRLEIR